MLCVVLLLLAGAAGPAHAAITNDDVAAMVRAGMPDSTVVATMGSAARRGEAQFDASPNGLIALRQAGASEMVLNALISIQNAAAGRHLSRPSGVRIAGTELPSFLLWQRIHPHSILPLVGRRAPRVDVHGFPGRVVVSSTRPHFEISGHRPDAGWQLVRFDDRDGRATLRLRSKSGSDFLTNAVFDDRDLRALQLLQIQRGGFAMQPAEALPPGEYALCAQAPGGGWLRVCYPFQVGR